MEPVDPHIERQKSGGHSKMKLPESWTDCAELLRAFNKEGVEYLLFGKHG